MKKLFFMLLVSMCSVYAVPTEQRDVFETVLAWCPIKRWSNIYHNEGKARSYLWQSGNREVRTDCAKYTALFSCLGIACLGNCCCYSCCASCTAGMSCASAGFACYYGCEELYEVWKQLFKRRIIQKYGWHQPHRQQMNKDD